MFYTKSTFLILGLQTRSWINCVATTSTSVSIAPVTLTIYTDNTATIVTATNALITTARPRRGNPRKAKGKQKARA